MAITVLQPGQHYVIRSFLREVPQSYRLKLLSMGLVPGAQFKAVRFAPFGDTLHIEINDFSLSLRARELQQLVLEVVEDA